MEIADWLLRMGLSQVHEECVRVPLSACAHCLVRMAVNARALSEILALATAHFVARRIFGCAIKYNRWR